MSQELALAEDQLRATLDRYVRACSSARDACLGGVQINGSPEFLTLLDIQSNTITSHIQRLQDALAIVHSARNSTPKVAPITTLPAEILARIFQLVISGQTCLVQRNFKEKISHLKYPLHPDNLAHVCLFWRRVAIGTPSLWTHIDIALDHFLNPGLFARAKVYAIRAGQLPLEIHISDAGSERERKRESAIRQGKLEPEDPSYDPSYNWENLHEFKIFASDSVNITTLEMDLRVYDRFREVYFSVLEYFFARCKPGVLTQYIMRYDPFGSHSGYFIEPAGAPHSGGDASALLQVPADHLEELWLRTPVMRIGAICPYWRSKAYHGLVELYIHPGAPVISEFELNKILRASPKLQVFHFNFNVFIYELADDEDIESIYLEDLQDLNLMVLSGDDFVTGRTLQQITPGSKPLQLSLAYFSETSIADFFSRANVTRLYVWNSPQLGFLFDQCPRLEILVLNELGLDTRDLRSLVDRVVNPAAGDFADLDRSERVYQPMSASATQIETLYLLWHSEFAVEEIRAVIEGYSVQRIFIYNGQLSHHMGEERVVCKNTRNIKAKLSTITGCTIEYYPEDHPGSYDEGHWMDPDVWIRAASSVLL